MAKMKPFFVGHGRKQNYAFIGVVYVVRCSLSVHEPGIAYARYLKYVFNKKRLIKETHNIASYKAVHLNRQNDYLQNFN